MPSSQLSLSDEDRATLEYWTRCSTIRAGHAERARVVLAIADGAGTSATARLVGVSRPTVIKWRDRFLAHGLAGLDDRARSGRPKSIDDAQNDCGDAGGAAGVVGEHALVHAPARPPVGDQRRDGRAGVACVPRPAVAQRDVEVLERPGTGGQGPRRRRALPGPAP